MTLPLPRKAVLALGHAVGMCPELAGARFRTNLGNAVADSVTVEVEEADAIRIADVLTEFSAARPAAYVGPITAKELHAAWANAIAAELNPQADA
jgi:hypothetical protein